MPDVVRIGQHWFRVAKSKAGDLEYESDPAPFYPPQMLAAEVTEATTSPEVRIPATFRDLSGGAGQAEVPQDAASTRYDRTGDAVGEGVDASLTPEGPVVLAAKMNTANLLVDFASVDGALYGVLQLAGSPVCLLAMGTVTHTFDGSLFNQENSIGQEVTGPLVQFRGATGTVYQYAPCGFTDPVYYNSSGGFLGSWSVVGGGTLGPGSGVYGVQSMVVLDGEVVCARVSFRDGGGSACVFSFDDGGSSPTPFGVIDPVGDPAFPISQLVVFQNRVVVLKSKEGVFVLANDRRTLEQEVFPELGRAILYAEGAKVWRGVLWLPTNRGLYAITPQWGLQHVGPEATETTITKGQRGLITAVAGDSHNLYGFRFLDASTSPVLYKANVRVGPGGVEAIAWHPFQSFTAGNQCASMHWVVPTATEQPFLFVHTLDGATHRLRYCRLPGQGRDPRADSTYRYCPGGTLYYSRTQARFPAINKGWYGVQATTAPLTIAQDGQTATSALTVRTRYKLASTALTAVSPFGYTEGAAQTTGEGARDQFFLRGRALDVAVRLATSDDTVTPQLRSLTPEYDLEPDVVWQHRVTLDLTEGSAQAGGGAGGATPLSPQAARTYLRTLPGSGTVVFTDPYNETRNTTIPIQGVKTRARGDGQAGLDPGTPGMLVSVVLNEQEVQAV